ncbi:hypothetical protein [Parabacteroides faecis]|uniref:GIY-YIG nuclease family protein n=1 Tax=Parabacteroides faecis TaxID=1217282 RepID=A0ABR6KUV6_9BACT|nr:MULTISPECIES: hypothetical protein [Parabacteroides]MBB4625174.1 hypothetical protein [Parabacteroides faecis]GGK19001.1 hypothetical protein GCM10007084_47850 [Parabacteroides faecis]
MPCLTLNEINESFPESVLKLQVIHHKDWWQNIILPGFPAPIRMEFNETIRDRMPASVKTHKGIYMFFIEPNHPFVPEIKHLMYVGRVLAGRTGFNFFKRLYHYVKDIGNRNAARNRQFLTNLWPDHTFVYFYCLDGKTDDEIIEIEKLLINKIVPPLNNEFIGIANRTRDLYN